MYDRPPGLSPRRQQPAAEAAWKLDLHHAKVEAVTPRGNCRSLS